MRLLVEHSIQRPDEPFIASLVLFDAWLLKTWAEAQRWGTVKSGNLVVSQGHLGLPPHNPMTVQRVSRSVGRGHVRLA